MADNGNNGKKTIAEMATEETAKGIIVDISAFRRQDGIITKSIDDAAKKSGGVILSVLNSDPDEEARQILKHARWKDQEQRVKYVKALSDCRFTGATNAMTTLLDLISANTAGDDGWLIRESYDALNHTTFTTNQTGDKRRGWLGNKGADSTNSNLT